MLDVAVVIGSIYGRLQDKDKGFHGGLQCRQFYEGC